jgi:hypothetical protein
VSEILGGYVAGDLITAERRRAVQPLALVVRSWLALGLGVLIYSLGSLAGATSIAGGAGRSGLKLGPLVRVTGASPYPAACGSTPYPDSEVEFSLAADRRRPRRLVGAWIQHAPRAPAVAYSRNGGRSWGVVVPPGLVGCTGSAYFRSTDPWLSVGPKGVAYLATLPVGQTAVPAVQVSRSSDTGRSWSRPVFVERRDGTAEPDDKPTVAADPYRAGSVYVSWTRLRIEAMPGGVFVFSRVEFSRSRDGARTWSSSTTIDTPPAGWTDAIAQVLVPRRGQLLCVFSRRELAANHVSPLPGGRVRFYATRSRDSGRNWSHPTLLGRGRNLSLQDAEHSTPVRSGTTPVFTAATGPKRRVYVAWADVRSGDDSRIVLVRSRNGGRSWSRPRSVSKGADRPLNPDLAVAGNGAVALRFYDLRSDRAGDQPLSTRSWLRVSRNGRRPWRERRLGGVFDLRTAPVASGVTPGRFLGEYQGLVGLPTGFGTLFAQAQPRARIGGTDGFFRRIRFTARRNLR